MDAGPHRHERHRGGEEGVLDWIAPGTAPTGMGFLVCSEDEESVPAAWASGPLGLAAQ